MTKAFAYLRTSEDDHAGDKQGIEGQRKGCATFAQGDLFPNTGYEIVQEFVDDGVSGKVSMFARPAGKLLVAALLANGVKHVLVDKASRIGRSQPVFWAFIGMCRDNGITVLDSNGVNLCESVQAALGGLMSEMEHQQIVGRLARGKEIKRAQGRKTEGQYHYGEHPRVEYAHEREVVAKILKWHSQGQSKYRIVRGLQMEGIKTRHCKEFTITHITRILERETQRGKEQNGVLKTEGTEQQTADPNSKRDAE
jgi:DNA invertase Pin-like site-specific DNA recombinase